MLPILRFGGIFYKENEDVLPNREDFSDGFAEYILDCKAKNRKPLIIPLNEDIVMILQEYLLYRGGGIDDWLFCSVYLQLYSVQEPN